MCQPDVLASDPWAEHAVPDGGPTGALGSPIGATFRTARPA